MWIPSFLAIVAVWTAVSNAQAPTDEYRDCDKPQSGYLDNHNISPDLVTSPSFGILWKNQYDAKERWFARPLTFTPRRRSRSNPKPRQLVFLASTANFIRTLDAATGELINERQVQKPFLAREIEGCPTIPDQHGILGTPIIDPEKEIAYFFSVGYAEGTDSGVENGRSLLYAVDIHTLQDVPGFPVLIDGNPADNDPSIYFLGGTHLQRPAVSIVDGHIIGAYSGHCEKFNYTGMVVSVSTEPGVGVTSMFAVVAQPGVPPASGDINERGGQGGIWHGGMGISTIEDDIYIVSGNGYGADNVDKPAPGNKPISTLSQAVVHFKLTKHGKLKPVDYFQPYNYLALNENERDVGSSGFAILDGDVFSAAEAKRIGLTGGKEGKIYVLDVDDLGGFMNAKDGGDDVLQTLQADDGLFGGVASYPGEGGYIYLTPKGSLTAAYKFTSPACSPKQENQYFVLAGKSLEPATNATGVGIPTVTSLRGQPGTGIVWLCDLAKGLRAFRAVPTDEGVLEELEIPDTGPVNKFLRPAFGDGRIYVPNMNGSVICLGSK